MPEGDPLWDVLDAPGAPELSVPVVLDGDDPTALLWPLWLVGPRMATWRESDSTICSRRATRASREAELVKLPLVPSVPLVPGVPEEPGVVAEPGVPPGWEELDCPAPMELVPLCFELWELEVPYLL